MEKVGDRQSPTTTNVSPQHSIIEGGFNRAGAVPIPLDFLQGISIIAQRNLERRPPKLRLKSGTNTSSVDALSEIPGPAATGETSDIAYQIAEFIIRRKEVVDESEDLGAHRGLAAMERMCRMFEHVFVAGTAPGRSEDIS